MPKGSPLIRTIAAVAVACAIGWLVPAHVFAQASTGNIYGTAVDEQGGVLPGVSVTVSGIGAPQTTFTDARGEFHFLNLSPGSYKLSLALQGFSTVERENVIVQVGQNTNVQVPMKISAVAATVTVTGESPLVDPRRSNIGANYQLQELKSIPTGRDPWVILQQVPGVQIDRINVAGTQSGQQSNYLGMGTDASQNAFNMDGVTITDMSAVGSSPTYYDFDQFQEVQVSTGGTDPSIAVPGVTLNMVTKRGTNEPHGSARYFYAPGSLQSSNVPDEAKQQADLGLIAGAHSAADLVDNKKFDRICEKGCKGGAAGIQDYGVEAGGALWKDKAWLWGSYARNEIPLTQLGGTSDTTYLLDYGGKLNVQAIPSNSFTLFYFRGDKQKLGRSAGVTRPQETSVDQTGPTTIWKGADNQVFGPSVTADVSWNYIRGGFGLIPEGDGLPSDVNVYQDPNLVYHRSYQFYETNRPQHQVTANSSLFFNTGSLGHEIKAGFGWRNAPVQTTSFYPGNDIVGKERLIVRGVCPEGCAEADIYRAGLINYKFTYYDGFIGDTITASNLTVNVGVRYDYQYGANLPSVIASNPAFPDLVPGVTYGGTPSEFTWKTFQPRVGLNYALGSEKKTLLRASYARFADQLGGSLLTWDNPTGGAGQGGSAYVWNDANHNHNVDPGELGPFIRDIGGFDHTCPTCLSSANVMDPNLKAPLTDEFQIGVDHELLPAFAVSLTGIYRHRHRLTWSPYIGVTGADYTDIVDPGLTATDYLGNVIGTTGPVYGSTLPAAFTGGQFITNRPDYSQNYYGGQLQLVKRLSDRWMMHGSFAYNDWKQKIDNKATACLDPTNQLVYQFEFGFPGYAIGPSCSNSELYQQSAGSGNFGSVWLNSHWSFNVSGLYQLPLDFNVAANFFGRQGYVNPYYVQIDTGNGEGTRDVLVGNPSDHRLKNVYELDLRLEKIVPLFQQANLTLSVDVFNLLNGNTILQREANATPSCTPGSAGCTNPTSSAGTIYEFQNPRTFRFGARISF